MYIICQLYRTCLLDIPGNLVMTDVITLILSHWHPVFFLLGLRVTVEVSFTSSALIAWAPAEPTSVTQLTSVPGPARAE